MVDSQLLIYPRVLLGVPERLGGGGVVRLGIAFPMDWVWVINILLSIKPSFVVGSVHFCRHSM